jgi:hypothetical protein
MVSACLLLACSAFAGDYQKWANDFNATLLQGVNKGEFTTFTMAIPRHTGPNMPQQRCAPGMGCWTAVTCYEHDAVCNAYAGALPEQTAFGSAEFYVRNKGDQGWTKCTFVNGQSKCSGFDDIDLHIETATGRCDPTSEPPENFVGWKVEHWNRSTEREVRLVIHQKSCTEGTQIDKSSD